MKKQTLKQNESSVNMKKVMSRTRSNKSDVASEEPVSQKEDEKQPVAEK